MNTLRHSKFFAILVVSSLLATLMGSTAFSTSVRAATTTANANAIATGGDHTCKLIAGGVKCWGSNDYGQLGDNTTTDRLYPVNVTGLTSGVKAIAAGAAHTCALTTGGGVKCWGSNWKGQLGDQTNTDRHTPVNVFGLASGVSAIAAGGNVTCALMTVGGVIKCWGANESRQLGNNSTTDSKQPVNVIGLIGTPKAIATGGHHTCALTTVGTVQCWGENGEGQLGDGSITDRPSPVYVLGFSGASAIATGFNHTCGLKSGGVKCWGYNWKGKLGVNPLTYIRRVTPIDVTGLTSGVAAIATGGDHTCAVTTGGGVKCWGVNIFGALGNNTTTNSWTPVNVSALASGVSAIATGEWHTCGLTTGGGVKCWGYNASGQLGNGTITNSKTPVYVVEGFVFRSNGSQDGWVLESGETLSPADTNTSSIGGTLNSTYIAFALGDDAAKKQYRGILSFSTGASLPDNAVITSVWLKNKKYSLVGGGNPVTIFQGFMVDLKNGFFSTSAALQTSDFQAPASSMSYGPFSPALVSGWYSINLTSGKAYINKLSTNSGLTQIRLRFKLDDNNNTVANYLILYSGNAPVVGDRPQLVIIYYVP